MLYILCVKCKFSLSIILCQFIIINIINNNSLNISHNLAIPNYIIPINKGEKGENNFCLYHSAINIHIISYLLTNKKKEMKWKNPFCFACMTLLLIYMCLCLVLKMNCMYTCWVDCSMSNVNCVLFIPACYWRGFA